MTPTPLDADAVRQLRALYAELPTVQCRRLCANSCRTRIGMSTTERGRIERAVGKTLPPSMDRVVGLVCPLLSPEGSCTVYGLRPLICRLWGVSESMRCPHGCTPSTGTWLGERQMLGLMIRAYEIGGGPGKVAELRLLFDRTHGAEELYARLVAGDEDAGNQILKLGRRRSRSAED
jgi:hypothetical protein